MSQAVAEAAVRAITVLPESVGLVSLRDLARPITGLMTDRRRSHARLNPVSLEALAAAQHLDAELCLALVDENPQLIGAARELGCPTRLLAG